MRLIDADALLRDIEKYHVSDGKFQHWVQIQPTIEPEQETGKWILITDNNGQHCVCDKCGEWKYHQNQKFCGECGAKMEGNG